MAIELTTEDLLNEEIHAIRPSTDANLIVQILFGLFGTLITSLAVFPLKTTNFSRLYMIVHERGPVQYLEIFMFFMIVGLIVLKFRIMRIQSTSLGTDDVDTGIDFNDEASISALRSQILESGHVEHSIAYSRMDRLMALWLHSKDISRVSGYATTESDRDASSSDSSYALSRVLIWAIPILGFIGTVMGLGDAVSGFSSFLSGAADLSSIKGAISDVTAGLGVAFDTTLLALVLSVFVMFPLSAVQRREENLFVEIDNYLEDAVISHLPSSEQQPIVIENLEDSIEAAFRRYIPDPDRYEEVFTRSIERASTAVEERFAGLTKGYESTLHDLSARLASGLSGVGDSLEGSLQKVIDRLHEEEEALLTSRRGIGQQELDSYKRLMGDLAASVKGIADDYRHSAETLQKTTQESMDRSLEASGSLAQKMTEITRLAAGIQDLLHVEEAMQQSLKGIETSDEFQKTLQDLRSHLNATSDFCNRMSKPRVIKFREAVGE